MIKSMRIAAAVLGSRFDVTRLISCISAAVGMAPSFFLQNNMSGRGDANYPVFCCDAGWIHFVGDVCGMI